MHNVLGMVTHTFDSSIWEVEELRGSLSSKPAWSIWIAPRQPGLHRETCLGCFVLFCLFCCCILLLFLKMHNVKERRVKETDPEPLVAPMMVGEPIGRQLDFVDFQSPIFWVVICLICLQVRFCLFRNESLSLKPCFLEWTHCCFEGQG